MKVVAYLQIKQTRGNPVISAVTTRQPHVQRGALLMKLVLEIPPNAFSPVVPEAIVRLEPGVNFAHVIAHAELPEGVEASEETDVEHDPA